MMKRAIILKTGAAALWLLLLVVVVIGCRKYGKDCEDKNAVPCCSGADFAADQSNTQLNTPFFYNIDALKPIGQEFTPSFYALNVLELKIADASCSASGGPGGDLKVNIRENTIQGTIIGVSNTVHFPNCYVDVLRFEFPVLVTLKPGKKYVIEPVYVSGNTATVSTDNGPAPLYQKGSFILQGNVQPGKDLWFRTGLCRPAKEAGNK